MSLLEMVTIPPLSELETLANILLGEGEEGMWLLEGQEHPNLSVLVATAVVTPLQGGYWNVCLFEWLTRCPQR